MSRNSVNFCLEEDHIFQLLHQRSYSSSLLINCATCFDEEWQNIFIIMFGFSSAQQPASNVIRNYKYSPIHLQMGIFDDFTWTISDNLTLSFQIQNISLFINFFDEEWWVRLLNIIVNVSFRIPRKIVLPSNTGRSFYVQIRLSYQNAWIQIKGIFCCFWMLWWCIKNPGKCVTKIRKFHLIKF